MRRLLPIAFLGFAALVLAGCEKPEPPVYPVEGKVDFLGKPPAGFTVEFSSQAEETKGLNARGVIEADGTFKLKTTVNGKEKDGAVAGPHRVVVVAPPASSGSTGPAILPVPLKYADYAASGLTFDVKPEGPNAYKIALEP